MLTDAERNWIADRLAQLAALEALDLVRLGDLYDRRFAEWQAAPQHDRFDPNEVISLVGVGFGEQLRRLADLQWVIATDHFGTDLALKGEPGEIFLFPLNMLAKRWEAGEVGFIPALATAASRSVDELRRGKRP